MLGQNLSLAPECVGVQFVPPAVVDTLYTRVMAVMDNCLKAPNKSEAAKYRAGELADVYEELLAHQKPRVQVPLVRLRAEQPAALRPSFTSVYYAAEQFPTGTPWNVVYHSETLKLLDAMLRTDRELQGRAGTQMVCLVGNDFLLRLVAGSLLLFLTTARASQMLDIRFYLVPSPSCRLAELLAAEDAAYRVQVVDGIAYFRAVQPRFASHDSEFVRTERMRAMKRSKEALRASPLSGRALPNPASLVAALVDAYCAGAQQTLCVPLTVCQCHDLQHRFCHSHVFFAQCAVSSHMAAQAGVRPSAFSATLAYDAVAADGTTTHRAETRRVYAVTVNKPLAGPYRLELTILAEDDTVCCSSPFLILPPSLHPVQCEVTCSFDVWCGNRKRAGHRHT